MNEKYPLPDEWRWAKLGEVCQINPQRAKHFIRSADTPTTFVPMIAVDEKKGTILRPEVVPYSRVAKGYTYFEENDVLFAKITPCMQNGKHVIARNLIDGLGFGTTEFHVIRPNKEVLAEWIHFFIRQPYFLQGATTYFTGAVGQQRVPEDFLFNYTIPLPPTEEQKRIAAKLQELTQEVERARSACEKQLEAAKALPAAYLREVFESEEAKEWERKRLAEVCEVIRGASPRPKGDPKYFGGKIPWIKISDVTASLGRHLEITEEFLTEEGKSKSVFLRRGTLIVTNSATIGLPKILNIDGCIHDGFLAFVNLSPLLERDFLYWYFLKVRQDLETIAPQGTQKNLNTTIAKNLSIPVPPLREQKQIVRELKEKVAEAEKVRTSIEKQLETLNVLPQAILSKAFRGEL